MQPGPNRALTVWFLIWTAVGAVGVLMYVIGHLPVMNPPPCPGAELSLPDGSRCIVGANIGGGLLLLSGVGFAAAGGLGVLVTPPAALLIRAIRARRPRTPPSPLPGDDGARTALTTATPDWAGRYPYARPIAPASAPDSQPLCLVSMVTGILAACFLVVCALLSVPLGLAAVITGAFGLSELRGRPSQGRRQAVAGLSCGAGSLLVLTVAFVVVFLTG